VESLGIGDPRRIGPYQLLGVLGLGGMGKVYLGMSPGGRAVAVKVVFKHLASDPMFIARFHREVEAAKAVSGAFTAPVIESGLNDRPPWFASSYVEGPSLAEAVHEREAPLPEIAVWRLAGGLVEALQAVHACNLVHRDLKPANVLLAIDGPRVIDFGIARALEGTNITLNGQALIGTPAFMSPEQANGAEVGPASDVFSLGSVIAFAATGHGPFQAGNEHTALLRVGNVDADLTGLAGPLRELVVRCLKETPADRPSLTQLLDVITAGSADFPAAMPSSFWPRSLAEFIGSRNETTNPRQIADPPLAEPPPAEPPTPEPAGGQSRSSSSVKRYASISAAIIVALIVGLAFMLKPDRQPPASVTTAAYTIAGQHYKDGLFISTGWKLSGKNGTWLTDTITATDATGAALAVQFEMPLPVAAVNDLGDASFSPVSPAIIDHGQGLVWPLRIPAHGRIVLHCRLKVNPGGVSESRLRRLASILTSVKPGPVTMRTRTVTLQSLAIVPKRLRIGVGFSEKLLLTGMLSNGKHASRADLSKVIWTTKNANSVTVSRTGRITALEVGQARITATVGKIAKSMIVIVVAQPQPGQSSSGGGQQPPSSIPPTQHHPSSTSIPSQPPTSPPASSPTTSPTPLP
jgi:serine/threonine protein kinase